MRRLSKEKKDGCVVCCCYEWDGKISSYNTHIICVELYNKGDIAHYYKKEEEAKKRRGKKKTIKKNDRVDFKCSNEFRVLGMWKKKEESKRKRAL